MMRPGPHLVVDAEQVQLPAQLSVVALLRLFQEPEVLLQGRCALEGGTVDALEHRPLLVPPPVGAGHGEELECGDVSGRGNMGPDAQVLEIAVAIDRDGLVGRYPVDQLELEGLVREPLSRSLPAHLLDLEGVAQGDGVLHDGLYPLQVLGRKWSGDLKVVVEAVVCGGAYAYLGLGEYL